MKKAGINWVAYGFESGSKRVLDAVKKSYDLAMADRVVNMSYNAGLYIGANFIFGLPEDDFDSMRETLQMAKAINAEWGNFYTTMAYPGSALYQEALEKKWPLPETWQGYSQYSYECLPLPTKHLSGGQILKFRDEAFVEYFSNPHYQEKLLRTFGPEAVESVQQMLSHRIARKHAAP